MSVTGVKKLNDATASLLGFYRKAVVRLQKTKSALVRSVESESLLMDRAERLKD